MPNTFTPNGDGLNDRLFPQRKSSSLIKSFRIFNRWGELLFEAKDMQPNNPLAGWDGTYQGKAMIPDVYVYVIDALCDTGQPLQIKGDITLVR